MGLCRRGTCICVFWSQDGQDERQINNYLMVLFALPFEFNRRRDVWIGEEPWTMGYVCFMGVEVNREGALGYV